MAQTCYFPNGSKAPGKYKPCSSSNTTYSTCCSSDQNDRCLLNGLCSWTDHYDYRAACTSKDWTGCQRVCPLQKNNTWVQVKECASNEYCCNLDPKNDCCKGDADRFSLKAPQLHSSISHLKTPVGAIVGGVVGGVAVVILLGLGWWFLYRKPGVRKDISSNVMDGGNKDLPKASPRTDPSILEADAGPEHVLVESDAQPIQPRVLYELPA